MKASEVFTLATFNIQVMAPHGHGTSHDQQDKRVLANLPAMLEAVEEDLTDLLPPGYSAVIKEWDSE